MRITNNKGFSLVELMVVVAIIGILATMSVGAIQKQVAKTRQSEAKNNLSSLFTSEKAFNSEFGIYYPGFNVIKWGVDGDLRYNTGFATAPVFANATAAGYPGAAPAAEYNNTNALCTAAGATCRRLVQAQNAPAMLAGATIAATTFTAAAQTDQLYRTNDDVWTIDQNKRLTNTTDAIQ